MEEQHKSKYQILLYKSSSYYYLYEIKEENILNEFLQSFHLLLFFFVY